MTSSDIRKGALALGALVLTSVAGQIATYPNLQPWYAQLAKPSFNPPNWVFAPVWTTLYVLTAFSLWRVLRLPSTPTRRNTLLLFLVFLVMNAAWSWMFFAAHSPALGLINILPQTAIIVALIVSTRRVDARAALCLVPLLGWVAFASVLNFSIWRLN